MSVKKRLPAHKNRAAGFTLSEVLIACFVGSIGLAGLLQLQTRAMQYGAEAAQRQRALALLHDMLERSRAAHGIRSNDVAQWTDDVRDSMPNAQPNLRTDNGQTTAQIAWRSPLGNNSGANECSNDYPSDWTCMHAPITAY